MSYVIASSRSEYRFLADHLHRETGFSFALITTPAELTKETLERLKPKFIFFPHWSNLIPADIYENFECVVFHMTDLPFGRGGSPLQNLISRGIYQTKMSAIKCVGELDAGPIYLKKDLSLEGTAAEIFDRASMVVKDMILYIIQNELQPIDQTGQAITFKRRKPEESNINDLESLQQVYDYIRMLDAEGYPNAFAQVGSFRFEFSNANYDENEIVARVVIRRTPK